MMVPDNALIAEIILFSVGFTSAKKLATKIITLYNLAVFQLSHQDHYDFGLRTIKAVLLMAGQLKKNLVAAASSAAAAGASTSHDHGHGHGSHHQREAPIKNSEMLETQILMQAVYDTNLPKFLKSDVLLFHNLMNDLFPDVAKLDKNQDAIEKSIQLATRELNYQVWPAQTDKIMQLYDQMMVRHGLMLVGPTGGGKTVSRFA